MQTDESQASPRSRPDLERPWTPSATEFIFDVRLSGTDYRVLMAVTAYARNDAYCYPSVATLGSRLKLKPGAIRLSLRNLVFYEYIRFEPDPTNRTGRRIVLRWREGDWPDQEQHADEESPRQQKYRRVAERCVIPITKVTPQGVTKSTLPPVTFVTPTEKQGYRETTSSHSAEQDDRSAPVEDVPKCVASPNSLPHDALLPEGEPNVEWLRTHIAILGDRGASTPYRIRAAEAAAAFITLFLNDDGSRAGVFTLLRKVIDYGLSTAPIIPAFERAYERLVEGTARNAGAMFMRDVSERWKTDEIFAEAERQATSGRVPLRTFG